MKDAQDIFNAHYARIRRDRALRQRLIEDPISGLKEHFGSLPEGSYHVEVIPQDSDTITIMLPAPVDGDTSDAAIEAASRRIFDLLFTDGVGGYLIPDEKLTWVLRDMRSLWSQADRRG